MRAATTLGVILMVIAFVSAGVPSWAGQALNPIEIRLVAQQPRGGPVLAVEGGDRTLEVEPETLLGPGDFASVGDVEWTEGKPGFDVTLTDSGAGKYERISSENVGRTLAVIVGGRVLMTPKILDPVRAQGFLLTMEDAREAARLAASIRQAVGQDRTP